MLDISYNPRIADKFHEQCVEKYVSLLENINTKNNEGVYNMEKKTMGSFMAALRKANGLTQQQVADKLNVSNKTVSKWECNEGYPEISMLPVIAELYSVSVDELLRGEKIAKEIDEEKADVKSTERIKFLIEKAIVKFTNNSIISIVLSSVALIMAYIICDIIYNYNVLWFGYAIILILCAVSIAVTLIAFNNFISGLSSDHISENETVEKNIQKCIKYITCIAFLIAVTLEGLLLDILMDAPSFLFVALPATAVIGCLIAYFVRSFLYKKFDLAEKGLSPEQKYYRKKHIKNTAIILVIVVLVSFLLPFIFAWHETSTHTIYSYPDGVGYQYDSEEEAEREYYKLKGYVTGEKTLYKITYEDYSDETKEYILYVVPSGEKFAYDNGVYNLTSTEFKDEEVLYFKTEEEAEKFKDENILDDENEYNASRRNLLFDDETLSVSYQLHNETIFSRVCDNLPVFIIIASCAFIIVFIASIAVYVKNKNKLK